MSANSPEYQKAYKQRHYADNRQKYIDQATARKAKLRDEVNTIKESTPCMDCMLFYPYYVMDFDHRAGEIKLADVAKLLNDYKRKAIFEEIAKCDLVCANCHRERTHQRLQAPVAQR